jgi:hypothetical protein
MAVVQVIAQPHFEDSAELRQQTTNAQVEVANQPGLRALLFDFDSTQSQRPFYAAVLGSLRPRMPAGMPLSIMALLSSCASEPSSGDWMGSLPIDEAVPMFFRLGGSARHGDNKSSYPMRELHCRARVGIATDENWAVLNPHQRVYLFAPRSWTSLQLAAANDFPRGGCNPVGQVSRQ